MGSKEIKGVDDVEGGSHDTDSLGTGNFDVLQQEHTDPVLNAKMHLVNDVSLLSTSPYNELIARHHRPLTRLG